MGVNVTRDGYFEIEYNFVGARGLDVQTPENLLDDHASPSTHNFMFRNKELRSRPTFRLEFRAPDNKNPPLGHTSFRDVNGVWHTVLFTASAAWQLAGNNQSPLVNPWSYLGGPNLVNGNPVATQAFANVLYYTNGGPTLASWDGLTQIPTFGNGAAPGATSVAAIAVASSPTVIPGSTGPLSIGGFYLSELNNQILLANVVVLDNGSGATFNFPQRLWWSANGIPTQWDPTVNTSAGFNDFLDVPDVITGIMTIGIQGYLFRSNGITQMSRTGRTLTPFEFDHLWASRQGIGNVLPWSIAQYGASGFFASTEQIYKMSVNSFNPIGGGARDAIYADIATASGNPVSSFVPNLGLGYNYPLYTISIPLTTFTRHYQYADEDNNWAAWDTVGQLVTGKPETVWTGQLPSFGVPGVFPISVSKGGTGMSGGSGGGSSTGGGGAGDGGRRLA
jgi:hypothetical protein